MLPIEFIKNRNKHNNQTSAPNYAVHVEDTTREHNRDCPANKRYKFLL